MNEQIKKILCVYIYIYIHTHTPTHTHIYSLEICLYMNISSIQSVTSVQLCDTMDRAACQASLSITNSGNLPKFMSIESVIPSNHLILCHPLLLLPSIFPRIRVFSKESILPIRWRKFWSFNLSFCSSNGYSGLLSFSIDWFDLLAVQETLKSLLQHQSWKASILWLSAFFIVQLTSIHDYWKNHSFE